MFDYGLRLFKVLKLSNLLSAIGSQPKWPTISQNHKVWLKTWIFQTVI